eukprot:Hpha_TRINITY_DN16077_c0_g1::TRINITY_DN16077_c0_g1_i1::g.120295::m.120295
MEEATASSPSGAVRETGELELAFPCADICGEVSIHVPPANVLLPSEMDFNLMDDETTSPSKTEMLTQMPAELQRLWNTHSKQGELDITAIGAIMHQIGMPVTEEEAGRLAMLLGGRDTVDLDGFLALCGGCDETRNSSGAEISDSSETQRKRRQNLRHLGTVEQRDRDKKAARLGDYSRSVQFGVHICMTISLVLAPHEIVSPDPDKVASACDLVACIVALLLMVCILLLGKPPEDNGRRPSAAAVPQIFLRLPPWMLPLGRVIGTIRKNFKPWMLFDLVALIPVQWFACLYSSGDVCGAGSPVLRINRLLLLRHFQACLDTVAHFGSLLTGMREASRVLRIPLLWFYMVHFMACAFLYVAEAVGDEDTRKITTYPQFSTQDRTARYLQAWDWASKTGAGLSRGQTIPPNDAQLILGLFTMITGVTVYAGFIAVVSAQLQIPTTYSRFLDKLEQTNSCLTYRGLPSDFRDECLNYYRHMFRTTGAFSDETGMLFSDLPRELTRQMNIALGVSIMHRVSLFKSVTDKGFFADLVRVVEPRVIVPNTAVFKEGSFGDEMYFVTHGRFEVRVKDTVVTTLSSGAVFGEIAVLLDVPRTATVMAVVYSTVLVLNKDCFDMVSEDYPEVRETIDDAAQPAIQAALEREEQRLAVDSPGSDSCGSSASSSADGSAKKVSFVDDRIDRQWSRRSSNAVGMGSHAARRKSSIQSLGMGSGIRRVESRKGSSYLGEGSDGLAQSQSLRREPSVASSSLSHSTRSSMSRSSMSRSSISRSRSVSVRSDDFDDPRRLSQASSRASSRASCSSLSDIPVSSSGKRKNKQLRDVVRGTLNAAVLRRAAKDVQRSSNPSQERGLATPVTGSLAGSVCSSDSGCSRGRSRLRDALRHFKGDQSEKEDDEGIERQSTFPVSIAALIHHIREKPDVTPGQTSPQELWSGLEPCAQGEGEGTSFQSIPVDFVSPLLSPPSFPCAAEFENNKAGVSNAIEKTNDDPGTEGGLFQLMFGDEMGRNAKEGTKNRVAERLKSPLQSLSTQKWKSSMPTRCPSPPVPLPPLLPSTAGEEQQSPMSNENNTTMPPPPTNPLESQRNRN